VLGEDAHDYQALLKNLSGQDVAVDYATTPLAALDAYQDQRILLAQPDFASAVIDSMPGIEWVQSTWAGIKPLLKTRRQDYLLTGVKDVFGAQMAEYSLAYILAHEQKLAERTRRQRMHEWWNQASTSVVGKTLGIMGTGSIGSHIARTARGFGLEVIGFSQSGKAREGFEQVFPNRELHTFLDRSDYVVGVLPDTPSTTGLMNKASFAAMKPSALFINIGRGNLVIEPDLDLALKEGQISAAVLDVFRQEPLPDDSPLWHTPHLVITGHIAARSCARDVSGIFLDNYKRFIQGQALNFLVDRRQGY
jgi:phosphoglycerate dehydrogenase-like enzyme